ELDPDRLGVEQQAELVVAVEEALTRLAELDERLVRVVECRFFAGMTEQEIAEALGISVRTVQREWLRARSWLKRSLE
ncbi:MAG: sigma-70 family RNA polymerase sigma factor, partial [Holophagales bacterium]|nr:sigma-70 family RNA polymerase sigma factor [Holophagales bacterium]